jgi:hypothetical protein
VPVFPVPLVGLRNEEKLTTAEAKLFQISINDLAKFTKLDFGKLAMSDTKETARKAKPRRIAVPEDVRFFPSGLEILSRPRRRRLAIA